MPGEAEASVETRDLGIPFSPVSLENRACLIFSEARRSQRLLLPEAIDDCVGADNPVRFIDAFVDGSDLAEPGVGRR